MAKSKRADSFEDWRDNQYTDLANPEAPSAENGWVPDPYMPDLLIRNYGDDWWGSVIEDFDGCHWQLKDYQTGYVTNHGVRSTMSEAKRACDDAAKIISPYASRKRSQQYSNGWVTDARDHAGNPVDVGDVLVNIYDGREYEVTEYDSHAVYTDYEGRDMQFASWYDVHLNWERKAGRKMSGKRRMNADRDMQKEIILPTLQAEIDRFNGEWLDNMPDGYKVDYSTVGEALPEGMSYIVELVDFSETMGTIFYEFEDTYYSIVERFERAVQKDTGDSWFYFEPNSSRSDLNGRAWFDGKAAMRMAFRKIAFNEYEFIPSEWKNLGRNDDDTCDVFWNGQLSVYRWDDGTWSVMEDLFDTLIWYESGATYADAIDNWIDQKEDGRFSLYAKCDSRKIASDGWDEDICEGLLDVLADCYNLQYEVLHSRRGAYVRSVGETYESLAAYAEGLGEELIDAARQLGDEYGDLTSEEIDDMD